MRGLNEDDRRTSGRYPLALGVRYRALKRATSESGIGTSFDISSGGILVLAEQCEGLRVGTKLEAIIEWPVLLDGQTPLQLVTIGQVVRLEISGFAVSFTTHQFHTMSRKMQASTGRQRSESTQQTDEMSRLLSPARPKVSFGS
jgi:hypothetical protein